MTQRIFDIENKKDMQDLWDIVPENIKAIEKSIQNSAIYRTDLGIRSGYQYIKINWHDKTEITRMKQEAIETDINRICVFWDKSNCYYYGILTNVHYDRTLKYEMDRMSNWKHCRRLTKQEIKELC